MNNREKKEKNELINVIPEGDVYRIITTRGALKLSKEDSELVRTGDFPSGIKSSPYLEGISRKSIRLAIDRAIAPKRNGDDKNQATLLWELVKNSYFFSDKTGYSYIVINNIPMPIDNVIFEDYLASLYYDVKNTVPSADSINLTKKMCRAKSKSNVLSVGVRVMRVKDQIVYDPLSDDGSLIVISKDGLTTVIPKDPLTIRFNGMLKSEIEDGKISDLKDLLSLWNLGEAQEIVLVGCIGTAFIPDIPHVITIITGPHGAGKSSLSDAVKVIVDPNVVVRNSLRFDEREIAVSSMHEWVNNFDNVNSIIPDPISDLLCRISTGQGFRKRKLYTDQDDLILQYRRPIVMSAINEPGYNPDFLDRALIIRLDLILESKRKTDAEIQELISELAPKIRGLYLGSLSKAIEIYPQIKEEFKGKLLRMADFIIWGEAVTRVFGYEPGKFYTSFSNLQLQETESTASENLLIMVLDQLLKNRKEWKGTTKELYDEIKGIIAEMGISEKDSLYRQLPKNYRDLGRRLTDLLPSLLNLGIGIKETRGNERIKTISRIEKNKKEDEKKDKEEDKKQDKEEEGKQKKLDDHPVKGNVGNVGNVEEHEKPNENKVTNAPTSESGNVDTSKANNLTDQDELEKSSRATDITKNNDGHNVNSQEPEKSNASDITDINDITSSVKGNQKNNSPKDGDIPDSGYRTDFYRIKIGFQYEFEKDGRTIKVNCKEGEVRKLSEKTAILHRAYLEKACPEGHWDSIEKQCITDGNGGETHE